MQGRSVRRAGRLRAIFLCAFLLVWTLAHPQRAPGTDAILERRGWIKINLQSSAKSLQVTVPGAYKIKSAAGVIHESRAGGAVTLRASGGGVSAVTGGKTVGNSSTIIIEPANPASGGYFVTPSNSYRGRLVAIARGGTFRVLNQIMIEDWLKGVLPAEIGPSPMEALKAQAVAARSESVAKLNHPPHAAEGFDFCTAVHCQVYKGMNAELPESNQACAETFGIVLLTGAGILDAVYHDVCGGVTAGAEDVWDSPVKPGLVPVLDRPGAPRPPDLSSDAALARLLASPSPDTFCNSAHEAYHNYARKYYRWEKSVGADQLQKISGIGRVRDIVVQERRPSGRVRKLQITGDRGTRVIEKELPIRRVFGLWSGLFVLDVEKSGGYVKAVKFRGAGHGHGVGLCQQGARVMAAEGNNFQQILSHYYRDTAARKIYRP